MAAERASEDRRRDPGRSGCVHVPRGARRSLWRQVSGAAFPDTAIAAKCRARRVMGYRNGPFVF